MGFHAHKTGRPIFQSALLAIEGGHGRRLATQATHALPPIPADHDEFVGDLHGRHARGGRPAQVRPLLLRSRARAQHTGGSSKETLRPREPIFELDGEGGGAAVEARPQFGRLVGLVVEPSSPLSFGGGLLDYVHVRFLLDQARVSLVLPREGGPARNPRKETRTCPLGPSRSWQTPGPKNSHLYRCRSR